MLLGDEKGGRGTRCYTRTIPARVVGALRYTNARPPGAGFFHPAGRVFSLFFGKRRSLLLFMGTRGSVVLRPLSFTLSLCLVLVSSVSFYEQAPPQDVLLRLAYEFLHGAMPDAPAWGPGVYPAEESRAFRIAGAGPTYYCRLHQVLLNAQATSVILTFSPEHNGRLPALEWLVRTPSLSVAWNTFGLRKLTVLEGKEPEVSVALDFPDLPRVAGTLTVKISDDLSFWVRNASIVNWYGPFGPNVWGILIVIGLVGLLVALAWPTTKAHDAVLREWRVIDEERQVVADRFGNGDDAVSDRRAAAMDCLNSAQSVILSHYDEALRTQVSSFWLFGIGTLVAVMLAGFLVLVAGWPAGRWLASPAGVSYPVGGLARRITALEAGRGVTWITMLAVVIIGIVAVVANLGLSFWRAKFVARQVIRQRLRKFDVRLRESIFDAMRSSNEELQRHEERLEHLRAAVADEVGSLRVALKDGNIEVLREQQEAMRRVAKRGKELAGELKREFRNATKTIA